MLLFYKQKTAYCVRNSDWSSDVGSSDLTRTGVREGARRHVYDRFDLGGRGGDERPDPPARVGREPDAARGVVLVGRAHDAEHALLGEILDIAVVPGIAPGYRPCHAGMTPDDPFQRLVVAPLLPGDEDLDFLLLGHHRLAESRFVRQEHWIRPDR